MRLLRLSRLTWMAVGASAAYFLDPDRGRQRRNRVRTQLAAQRDQLGRGARRPITPAATPVDTRDPLSTPLTVAPGDGEDLVSRPAP